MKLGLFLPLVGANASSACLGPAARTAEARGFHSLWVGEHVALFDAPRSRYPYAPDGSFPIPPDTGMLEPFTALSYAAALTTTIRLGTGICLVPQRQPLYTAKSVADLDVLSNGRVDFGVGIGWQREEFDALGVPFEHRGTRCRDYLDAMKSLWQDDVSNHAGEFTSFAGVRFYPKPVQRPHPPILFGGESTAALRRVAAMGDGWFGFNVGPDEIAGHVGRLDEALAHRGRTRSEISVKVSPYLKRGADADGLRRYREAGVDEVILTVAALTPEDAVGFIEASADSLGDVAAAL